MSEQPSHAEILGPLVGAPSVSVATPEAPGPPEPGIRVVDHRYERSSGPVSPNTTRPEGSEELVQAREQERANAQVEFLIDHFGRPEDVQEAIELSDYALERLGITEAETLEYVRENGVEAIIEGHRLGEALLEVGDMTPAEARRAKKDFIETPGNAKRLDKRAKLRRWWYGVSTLAGQA